jgi:hypothetical protein
LLRKPTIQTLGRTVSLSCLIKPKIRLFYIAIYQSFGFLRELCMQLMSSDYASPLDEYCSVLLLLPAKNGKTLYFCRKMCHNLYQCASVNRVFEVLKMVTSGFQVMNCKDM